ncbi:hypothetical protein [Desulfurobacterium atlanticum]|uniref:NHL repeat-containing protein n=1 Tax=Desulfurobacterium atlanticum TaxID=240169 RepID=A0A238YHY7_9BACT|nr:hypothetical protein [Desulfurobacterium atlanticum]SNR70408.1 hypothetical protein SAMN06265340_103144 [Desulfurobacterium atlanticum]
MKRLLTFIFVLFFALPVRAENFNFKWYMSLKKDKRENFMRQPVFITFSNDGKKAYVVDAKGKLFSYTADYGTPGAAFFAANVLDKPIALAKIASSEIAVINRGRKELTTINLKTRKIRRVKLPFIPGVFYFKNGNYYILDMTAGDIAVFDKDFNPVRTYFHGKRDGFIDFKIKRNKLYALSPISKEVVVFSVPSGDVEKVIKLDSGMEKLLLPVSLDLDKDGYIYVCDKVAGNIKVFYKEGGFKTAILSKGQKKGELYYPNYIAFDKYGKLWVVEEGNGRVEVFDRESEDGKSKK